MIEFNDEPGWQVICIKCTKPFVVSDKFRPREGDPYVCTRCSEQVEDEYETNGKN